MTAYAPSGKDKARAAKHILTYPMSPTGPQGVFMPSFMPVGLKLWALEGYTQADRQTELF